MTCTEKGKWVTFVVWALALSWWSGRPRVLSFCHRALQNSETLGKQTFMYHSAMTVFLSRSGTEATWPVWRRSLRTSFFFFFLSASRSLEFYRWALTWEKPDWLLPGSRVILVYRSLITRDDVPDTLWSASVKFSKHVKAPLHPNSLLFLGQLVGHPTGATLPYTHVITKDRMQTSQWKIQTVFYVTVCNLSVFFDQTLHLGHVLFGMLATVSGRPQRSLSLNFVQPSWNSSCHLSNVYRDENGPQTVS